MLWKILNIEAKINFARCVHYTLYSTFKRSFSVGTYVFSAFYFAIFWYQLENRPTLLPIYELDNYIFTV